MFRSITIGCAFGSLRSKRGLILFSLSDLTQSTQLPLVPLTSESKAASGGCSEWVPSLSASWMPSTGCARLREEGGRIRRLKVFTLGPDGAAAAATGVGVGAAAAGAAAGAAGLALPSTALS